MTSAILQFAASAIVIVVAGTYLARFADRIAELTGLGRLLIGSVLLAGATSLPELTVDISAVRQGAPDLAVGDLLGSSLMNLLILAVLDLSYRSRGKMLSRTAAAHALSGTMSIAMTALAGLALVTVREFDGWSLYDISLASWLLIVTYVLGVRVVFLDQRMSVHLTETASAQHSQSAGLSAASVVTEPRAALTAPLVKALVGFVVAAAVIVLAGPWLARSAEEIATESGLGNTFVGTTLVAFSTSLPELVSSLAALRMGAFDLVVGNVFGSNTFNMLLLVPLDAVHRGPLFAAVSTTHVVSCLAAILATAVAIVGQLYHVERRRKLLEPDSWLMIVLILVSLGVVYRFS